MDKNVFRPRRDGKVLFGFRKWHVIVDLKMYRTSLVQWYQQRIGMECIMPSKKACRRFYIEHYADIWAEVRKYVGEPEPDATETAKSWMAVHGWTVTQNGWVRDRTGKPRFRGIKKLFMELQGFYKPTDKRPVDDLKVEMA